MLPSLSVCLSLSLPVCLPSTTSLYLSLSLPLLQNVFLPSFLPVPFWCLPDNLSFCLLSLTTVDSLCTTLPLYQSERQPVCLPVHFPLIYYLCLSVCLYLPFSLPMFLSVIPTFKPTLTPLFFLTPCCFVYSHHIFANTNVHLCDWGLSMILLIHWNIWANRKSFYPYLCKQLAVLKAE